jgi:multiple sugar transport system substrate-binding protein
MTRWPKTIQGIAFLFLLFSTACSTLPAKREVSFIVFGDPAEFNAYKELVDAYNERDNEVQVELVHVPSPQEYRTRLVTEFAAGTAPDVTLMNYRRFAEFAANGLLEPIGPYLEQSNLINQEDFYATAIEAFTWQDTLICLPQNISSLVVYYNQDLFDAAGLEYPPDRWDWDSFVDTAVALTKDLNGDGTIDQYGLGIDPSLFRLAPFVWQNGGPLVDDQERPTRLTLMRPPSMAALQWFTDLHNVHHVVPGRVEEAGQDSESRFLMGTTAMFLNSRRGVPAYREIEGFTWDVAPLPVGKEEAGILHSDAYCLSSTTSDKEAAWQFIEFANSMAGQTIVARSGRTVPSLKAVAESEIFLESALPPKRAQVFINNEPTLRRVPLISTWQEIETVADQELERAFYGDITVEQAARLAFQRTEEYFLRAVPAVGPGS